MKKIVFIVLGTLISVVGLTAYQSYDQPEYESVASFSGDFKNLKVLPQSISKDSLDGLMKQYTVALGVKCTFCHEKKGKDFDFASDANEHKEITRHMIKMTNELNANEFAPIGKEFEHAMECATCHRGSTHPMKDTREFNAKKTKSKA